MEKLQIKTKKKKEVVNITDKVNSILKKLGAKEGLVHIFVSHTTCCLTTADLDPGTDLDMLEAIEVMFPKGEYRHPHDPSHVGEHIMSSIIGPSVTAPVENGKVVLGTWQEIVLVELSGPRERTLTLQFIPHG
jgi:secondary thiamine-phosphate synthase enzyme